MRLSIFVALTIFGVLGCTTEPSSTSSTMDAGPDVESTAVGACVPNEVSTGNSKNVGAYCTPGGGQCAQYPAGNATLCAIDLDPDGDNFCIKIGCKSHDACGEQACCTGRADNPIKACVPIECVDKIGGVCPPIPGLEDAGTSDGGGMGGGGGAGAGGGAGGSSADAGP